MTMFDKPKHYKMAKFLLCLMIMTSFCQCKKFLDEKVKKTDIVPTSLDQLQPLLDNININASDPYLLEVVADNFYLSTSDFNSRSSSSGAQHYIWKADAIPDDISWSLIYNNPVYYSNTVLDQLTQIKFSSSEQEKYNAIKGSCLFYRAYAFYNLAQLYCKPFSVDNESSPGVVLRVTSNPNVTSYRASVKESYERIISDLLTASELLPQTAAFPTRPTKAAAYAMLARTYLSMRQYNDAGKYSDMALQQKGDLIDFNTLIPVGAPPVRTFNPEVVYHSYSSGNTIIRSNIYKVDSSLYKSYNDNDLRKIVFFRNNTGANAGTYAFRGSYHGNLGVDILFTGLTTAELYLIRAESFARNGKIPEALLDLNTLMRKRWNSSATYIDITATDATDALNKILIERRKELVFRGQRWSDIRRFNLEGANITLMRIVGSTTYVLPPNDLRSVMLIPKDEINKSGIEQNAR
jgi:starch-binding outer membrane protein, SusD/RagB family